MEYAYSPYHKKKHEKKDKKKKFFKIKLPTSLKKWLLIILGLLFAGIFMLYLSLGGFKFFANHYFGLTFFNKSYLIILQNNYELRPGGGFITAYGNMDFVMGWPTELSFKNSYDIDTKTYIEPPYPHEEMLKNEWYEGYTFRDANWQPHFPDNAAELISFYQSKYPKKKVDGIFVINFSLIEDLIEAVGGVELNGKTITKNNLFNELEFEVNNIDRHNIEALQNRKNILAELAGALMAKAKKSPYLARDVILEGLDNKNMYLWFRDVGLQRKIEEKEWGNVVVPTERSDFLAVNLANLGSKKADRYVQPEIHYYANITKELPEITTEVTIRYPGFTNAYSDNYKGYLRLYLPKTADITSLPVDSETFNEGEFKVIGTKIILPAGSKTSLTYVYTLPRNAFLRDQYRLRLIKQSGSEFIYKIIAETSEGKLMESTNMKTRENRASFEGTLDKDIDLHASILPDNTPPYPIEQVFDDLNHIHIIWNEPVNEKTASNPKNFSIADLNKNDEITDVVTVTGATLIQPNIISLELEGITEQRLEFYRIDLKNISDLSDNSIIPNPKSITVVQRMKTEGDPNDTPLGAIPILPEDTAEIPASE